jgi:glycosyltransferase involved in cell wall biosynthesis
MASTNNKLETLNILHLSPFPYYSGGIDTWLLNFLKSFDGKFNILIYCTSPKEGMVPFHSIDQFSTVEIIYLGRFKGHLSRIFWSLKSFKLLYNQFLNNETIIVLSTPTMLPIIFLKMFNRVKGKVILSVRGQLSQDTIDMKKSIIFQKIVKFIEGKCIGAANIIIANGWDTQDFIKCFFGKDSEVIPNGYLSKENEKSITDDDIAVVRELKIQGKLIFSHVGTVRKIKCIDFILKAISSLSDEDRVKCAFVFIGKGMIKHYTDMAKDLGIEVYFLDEKKYVQPYYDLSDYVINVSGGSGISNSLIETLSSGRPVIVWNNKTFTQVIKEGLNGIYCEHRNSTSLSQGIHKAINNNGTFNEETIKNSAMEFHWDKVAIKWQQLLAK